MLVKMKTTHLVHVQFNHLMKINTKTAQQMDLRSGF